MFATLGRFVHRHRWWVLMAWVVIFLIGGFTGGRVMDRLSHEVGGHRGMESVRVMHRLDELIGGGGSIVALLDGVDLDDPATLARLGEAHGDLVALPEVSSVLDHPSTGAGALLSVDGTSTLVVVNAESHLATDQEQALTATVRDRLLAVGADDVRIGGSLVLEQQFQEAAERDLVRGEAIALPIAFVAMIFILGGLVAAGLPLLIAVVGVAASLMVLYGATMFTDVSVFAINVVTMFGIGLGIDYGLLVIGRFREERAKGLDTPAAIERTVATAGTTVMFSGLTVAVSLMGLFAFGEPALSTFGIAGIGVVIFAMTGAVTLLPALLSLLSRRIRPAKADVSDDGTFYRLARRVQRRALPVMLVVSAGLVLLATPFLHANFEGGDARSLPRSSEARAVALAVAERFPERQAEPVVVLADVDPSSPALADFVARIRPLPGVAAVSTDHPLPGGLTLVEVVPAGTEQGPEARELITMLRGLDAPFPTEVGGPAAFLVDFKQAIGARLPLAIALIMIATFVLLFLMTGSVAVPLKAIVMNLLSLGASFGALVWIFQDGNLSGLLGFDPVGSVDLFMPLLIFIFAFGLSMDYEVFLLARIKELHDQGVDSDTAVALGLQRTGKIITSAALLIVIVFAGFAAGEVLTIKQLGLGLALAVIVDATIVRSILVPATMKLLGEWNWWAPAPLRRLHDRFGLREVHDLPVEAPVELVPQLETV